MRPTKLESLQVLISKGLPIDCIIDVGVQHQTRELIAVFPNLPHILIEPAVEYHSHISANYKDINHTLVAKACGELEEKAILNLFDITGKGAITHTTITNSPVTSNYREIDVITVKSLIHEYCPTGNVLLKVDVDELEMKILRGASDMLSHCSCVIVEAPLSIDNNHFFDRLCYLKANGFELWDLVDFCYYKNCLSQVDAVFVRSDLKTSLPGLNPWHDQQGFSAHEWVTMFQ